MSHPSELHALDEEMRDIVRRMASTDFHGSDSVVHSEEEINEKLSKLHCPFTWKPFDDVGSWDIMSTTECKLSRVEDQGEEFTAWTTFVLNLILCFEYAQRGAIDYAFEKLEECQKIVDHAIASDFSVPVMGIGLKHVVHACKIFLLIKSKQIENATEELGEITEIQEMENRDQASIWSVRGAVFLEYGLKGMKESIPFLERALLLDSECGEWHFLLGKALARVRRIEDHCAIPDEREIRALEYAVNASKNTFYMVLLAQSYVDTARQVYFRKGNGPEWKLLSNGLNEKAFNMYRKAYENCNENPYVLGRCAFGFMRLSYPFKDMKLARRCIDKGFEKDPTNSFICNCAAIFYQKQNVKDKAKYYFTRSAENGCYSACIELLSMKMKENKSYDPIADLERYINIFKEKPRQEHLWALMGTYYYFVRSDFNVALNYWSKVIDSNIHSAYLKSFDNPWPGAPHPCNIGKTIINEIVKLLDENCSEEEKKTYEEILAKFKKHHFSLVKCVQDVHSERSQYKHYCASEQRTMPAPSNVWHKRKQNSVGKYWRVHPTSKQ